MEKTMRVLAVLGNLGLLLGSVMMWSANSPNEPQEMLILGALFLVPLLSLKAIVCGPDLEERRLRREVTKAVLRQKLKSMSEGKLCHCGNPDCQCGPDCTCAPGCTCEKCQPKSDSNPETKSGCCCG